MGRRPLLDLCFTHVSVCPCAGLSTATNCSTRVPNGRRWHLCFCRCLIGVAVTNSRLGLDRIPRRRFCGYLWATHVSAILGFYWNHHACFCLRPPKLQGATRRWCRREAVGLRPRTACGRGRRLRSTSAGACHLPPHTGASRREGRTSARRARAPSPPRRCSGRTRWG